MLRSPAAPVATPRFEEDQCVRSLASHALAPLALRKLKKRSSTAPADRASGAVAFCLSEAPRFWRQI